MANRMLVPWADIARIDLQLPSVPSFPTTTIYGSGPGPKAILRSEVESDTPFVGLKDPATLDNGELRFWRLTGANGPAVTIGCDVRQHASSDLNSRWQWQGLSLGQNLVESVPSTRGVGFSAMLRCRADGPGGRTVVIGASWFHAPSRHWMNLDCFLFGAPTFPHSEQTGQRPLWVSGEILPSGKPWICVDMRTLGYGLVSDQQWIEIRDLDLGALVPLACTAYREILQPIFGPGPIEWHDFWLGDISIQCETHGAAHVEVDIEQVMLRDGGSLPPVGNVLV